MRRLIIKIGLSIVIAFTMPQLGFTHDGDHGPVTIQAPKGGLIKGNEDAYIEVLYSQKTIQIYAYDKNVKSLAPNQVKLSAKVSLPKKKPEVLSLNTEVDRFIAAFDPKGAHRFTLSIRIEGRHADTMDFVIEPKK